MTKRRKRGTGSVFYRDGGFVALAPQLGGRGIATQFKVAKEETRLKAERALDAWLDKSDRIVRRTDDKRIKPCR